MNRKILKMIQVISPFFALFILLQIIFPNCVPLRVFNLIFIIGLYGSMLLRNQEKLRKMKRNSVLLLSILFLCIMSGLVLNFFYNNPLISYFYSFSIWGFMEAAHILLEKKQMALMRVIYFFSFVNLTNFYFLQIESLYYIANAFMALLIIRIFNPLFLLLGKRGVKIRTEKGGNEATGIKRLLFGKTGRIRVEDFKLERKG